MDAVTDAEQSRFERHLARCDACAEEIAGLRETTSLLGAAAAAHPPAVLKERVLAAAAEVKQLPPASREPVSLWLARRVSMARRRQGAWTTRLALACAAAFVGVAVALGGVALTAEHRLSQAQAQAEARSHAIATVLDAPDATMLSARVAGGGTANIVMSRRQRALVFTTAGLSALPPARCYQLFLMGPAGDRPAGRLPAPHQGMTAPIVATGLTQYDKVGLTVEPAGGSTGPTSPPILLIALPA